MAAHTKIIDLFGLPACGKTSLTRYISEQYGERLKIATMPILVQEAKKDKGRLRKAFSPRYFSAGFRLRLLAPFDKKRRIIPLFNWPSHARYYSYAKKYPDYDIVLVDHGDIQDIVSLERGEDLHNNNRFSNGCIRYLNLSLADLYVYCNVPTEIALERMQLRGRNSGRIDVMGDVAEQLQALESEKRRFDYFAGMLSKKKDKFVELDMNKPVEQIAESIMNVIIGKVL